MKVENDLEHDDTNLDTAIRFQTQGNTVEAERIYRRILERHPNHSGALHLLGTINIQRGDHSLAINLISRAIEISGNIPQFHNSLGMAFKLSGNTAKAVACFTKALSYNPAFVSAQFNLSNTLRDQGNMVQSIKGYQRLLELTPTDSQCHSDMLLALQCITGPSAEEIYNEHLRWATYHAAGLQRYIQPHTNVPDPDRRLRVGYVSPDLWNHVVARFFLPVLVNHDPKQVESFCYASINSADHVTARLRAASHGWRDIRHKSDREVVEIIRADKIDILVDLTGHTGDSRILVFAYKPAPVQVTWLGYPDTTGLKTMDCRITDAIADPPGVTDRFHSEQLVRLPKTAWAYQSLDQAPVLPGPSQRGEPFTFGSFNNFMKLTDTILDVWTAILGTVPGSKLLLKAVAFSDPVARRKVELAFERAGIPLSSLIVRQAVASHLEHMQLYSEMDLALDPFPYHGTTTTCEALWMGVPVVTLVGHRHVSRVGVSLLTNAGLPEFIAHSVDHYVQIAKSVAQKPQALWELRHTLRQRFESSPLGDTLTFTKDLEAAYRVMWQRWCANSSMRKV